jgi:site-specific recombinase XerD
VLSPDEVERLVAGASARSSTGIRARALILTLHRGGLRIGEALALYPKDVDLARGTIRILHGKGGKARTIGIDPGAVAAIGRWLDRRAHVGIGRRRPLFCTLAGKALYPQQVRATLTRLAGRAGIDKRVHPHGLRHAHAAHLDRSGVPITTIVRQLGHANLAVTTRYLQTLGQEEHLARVQTINWQIR